MKQNGKLIVGSNSSVDRFTDKWIKVSIHPSTFYRRYNDFIGSTKMMRGLHTIIDQGDCVSVRFATKVDFNTFNKIHRDYI